MNISSWQAQDIPRLVLPPQKLSPPPEVCQGNTHNSITTLLTCAPIFYANFTRGGKKPPQICLKRSFILGGSPTTQMELRSKGQCLDLNKKLSPNNFFPHLSVFKDTSSPLPHPKLQHTIFKSLQKPTISYFGTNQRGGLWSFAKHTPVENLAWVISHPSPTPRVQHIFCQHAPRHSPMKRNSPLIHTQRGEIPPDLHNITFFFFLNSVFR